MSLHRSFPTPLPLACFLLLLLAAPGGPGRAEESALGKVRETGKPGRHHELLEPLTGRWDVRIFYRLRPEASPERARGTAEYRWVLGKRFLRQTIDGKGAAGAYEGEGLLGYDNVTNRYIGVFADSVNSSLTLSEGRVESNGRVFTFTVERSNALTGRREKVRARLEIETTRRLLYQVFDGDSENGPEMLRIEYERK